MPRVSRGGAPGSGWFFPGGAIFRVKPSQNPLVAWRMQSIGERLEEARKRRGISIREASEATKIRGDFLLNFENNQFDVGLPDIYVRGFLRNYSSFLKIDPEKIVTDFNATLLGEMKPNRRESRELFGRMEIPERPRPVVEGGEPAPPTAPRRQDPPDGAPRPTRHSAVAAAAANPELTNYVKIGMIIAGGVVAVLVIVWLVMAVVNSASTPDRAGTATTPAAAEDVAPLDTITLVATGDVWVKVTQVRDNTVLFDGQLVRGERKQISRRGPVLVAYSEGANLQVEKRDGTFRMPSEGLGRSTVN